MTTMKFDDAPPQAYAPFPPVLGLIGTFAVCGAYLMSQLSETQLQPLAQGLWVLGLAMQAGAFGLAMAARRARKT